MSGVGTLSSVKTEPEDVSLPRESSREDVPERTHKRRRLVMVVEVPTLEEVNQRRRALAAKLVCKEEPDVKPWVCHKAPHPCLYWSPRLTYDLYIDLTG